MAQIWESIQEGVSRPYIKSMKLDQSPGAEFDLGHPVPTPCSGCLLPSLLVFPSTHMDQAEMLLADRNQVMCRGSSSQGLFLTPTAYLLFLTMQRLRILHAIKGSSSLLLTAEKALGLEV